jgi:hypothetical protein
MRENRPYGSEGGVGAADPDPYHTPQQGLWITGSPSLRCGAPE